MNKPPTVNPLLDYTEAGYRAFFQSNFDNPHSPGSLPYKEWERGWNKGYFQNLKKVVSSEYQRQNEEAA